MRRMKSWRRKLKRQVYENTKSKKISEEEEEKKTKKKEEQEGR